MPVTVFRGMKPYQQLLFSAFIIIVSFLAVLLVSVIIAIPLFGIKSVLAISDPGGFSDPEKLNVLKYFQVAQSIGFFILPSLIIPWLFSGKATSYLQLDRSSNGSTFLIVILLIMIISPGINFLGFLNSRMAFPDWLSGLEEWMRNAEDNAMKLTEAFLKMETTGSLIFNLFMIAFLPAIGEELLFRGIIQKLFSQWTKNFHVGIWISAFLFSALHLQFYGFLPRFVLGLLFGYILVWTKNLWLPILAHFINNAAAVILYFLIHKELVQKEIEDYGAAPGSYYMAILSFGFGIILLWLLKTSGYHRSPEKRIIDPDRQL